MKPTGKRFLIACDINASSTSFKDGVVRAKKLRPILAAAALAMTVARTEAAGSYEMVGYSGGEVKTAALNHEMKIGEVVHSLTEATRKV